MGVSSSESHDLTAFYEMFSASFGVLSQITGFYPSLDRIVETMLRPLNLGPGGGSYNEPISRLQHIWPPRCMEGGTQHVGVLRPRLGIWEPPGWNLHHWHQCQSARSIWKRRKVGEGGRHGGGTHSTG